MPHYKLRVDGQGRMVLPAALRKELGVERGGQLTLDVARDEVRLSSARVASGVSSASCANTFPRASPWRTS